MKPNLSLAASCACLLAGGLASSAALATSYTVNNPNDSQVAGLLSLREAITAANTNAPSGNAAAGDAAGDSILVTVPVALTQGELAITDDVTITLNNGITVTNNDSRIFNITAAAGENVTINGGSFNGGGGVTNGGAISIAAGSSVNIINSEFNDNTATGASRFEGGGAIWNAGSLNLSSVNFNNNRVTGTQGNGGALLNLGSSNIIGGSFTGNQANRAGGAIENDVLDGSAGSLSLNDVAVSNNSVGTAPGNGGGLHQATGSVTVTGGSFSGNTAGNEGGGLWAGGFSSITGTSITDNVANGTSAANGGGGLFNNGGRMTVSDSTITGNSATQGAASGGGILNNANGMLNTLSVSGSIVSNNSTNRAGGGIEDNGGSVTLTNVTMNGNSASGNAAVMGAPGNGGAFHSGGAATILINGGLFSGNTAGAEGGGIWTAGTASINQARITGNTASGNSADQGGGGVFNQGGDMSLSGVSITDNLADGSSGSGGGVLSNGGSLSIEGSVISNNQANRAGGGLEIAATATTATTELTEVIMENNNAGVAPAVAAPGNGGAIHVSGNNSIDIDSGRFNNNLAALEGGGLWNSVANMTITNSSINNNSSLGGTDSHDGGGAVFNNGGTISISNAEISNNTADVELGSGGGILNITNGVITLNNVIMQGNSASRAGGALEDNGGGTMVTMNNVSLIGNSTGDMPGNGGAVHITGMGSVSISNSEVSGNTAVNEGGGLWNFSNASLVVTNSTVSGNSSPLGGGLFQNGAGSGFIVNDSTVANNGENSVAVAQGGTINVNNSIITGGVSGILTGAFNIIEDSEVNFVGSPNTVGESAMLADLANNGGNTQTHAISAGPAIDTADANGCGGNTRLTDQRGVIRPVDGDGEDGANCDIGAFEFAASRLAQLASTTGANSQVASNANNVSALGFTIQNPSDNGNLNVSGFSGRINAGGNALQKLADIQVYVDTNGDGVVDAGDSNVTELITGDIGVAGGFFNLQFDTPRVIASDASESYLIALRFSPTAFAGFGLLALPLLLLGLGRKFRGLAFVSLVCLGLAACSNPVDTGNNGGGNNGGGNNGGGNNGGGNTDPTEDDRIQFSLTGVNASEAGTNAIVIFSDTPITGPEITVE